MAPKIRLIYFNVRGVAEYIRCLLTYLKIEYEDVRLAIGGEEWVKLKPLQPFNKLPVLEIDGEIIAEAEAIGRYFAREHGLAGKNNIESAKCDMIVSALRDLNEPIRKWGMETDANKKEEYKKNLQENVCPEFFNNLMKQIKNNKYLVGNSLTWVDIMVAVRLYEFKNSTLLCIPQLSNNFKHLCDFVDRIHNLPGIKEWVAKRPATNF